MGRGNFGYGGDQRSYSFPFAGSGRITTSLTAVQMPNVPCEQVFFQNHPDSTDNVYIGGSDLPNDGSLGFVLEPGNFSPYLPIQNLNQLYHVEGDATTYLQYFFVR
jgi:hypothetical protein